MGWKSQRKKEENQEDLDQKINAFHARNEEDREKALLDLITKIIVEATLKEYYKTKDYSENRHTP